ncbi:alpha/beta hydrolase [Streptomyces sp. NBC_01180]|uniref:alpha/beta hydrolase n=1 Tax=Streptomyces sp. NBC_01180 TaxID=2903763 RepID=UPI003864D278|nr:alpha/beta hydrolase [Streptomyces sp. NBC_01180]
MKAVALYGTAGVLVLSGLAALAAAPPGSADAPAGTYAEGGGPDGRAATAPGAGAAEAAGTLAAAARAAAAGIVFGSCPKSESLPASVRCGSIRVPLDYARPDGRQISLTVSRAHATGKPAERQGALIYNPGGPGASSMFFPMAAAVPVWKPLAAAYDLVGYAPRGVGRSAPLSCEDPASYAKPAKAAPIYPSEAFKQKKIAQAKAYAQGCARRAGAALGQYNSLNNARDLDVLRAALGERKLTFMGASYGTYFGAVYATLFPSHVRRMVFDSAVDPDPAKIWYRDNLDQSLAFERRWTDFRSWVALHDKTYHLGRDASDVLAGYETARARLADRPVGGVGPAQLQNAFLQAGYYDDVWPAAAHALARYLRGDPKPLIKLAAPDPAAAKAEENSTAVYTAVECNDAHWPADWRVWDTDNTALARRAPFETWDNVWMNLPCAYWPAPRQQPLDVRSSDGALPPTLILAAERDAATPYPGALELQRRLRGSVLITERGAGTHGIGGGPNKCVNTYLDDYLLTGRTPVRRATCAPHPLPDPVSLERRTLPRPRPAL